MQRAPIIALFTTFAVAGCGGGDGGTRLSKEEYASKADAICSRYTTQTKALQSPSNLSELASVADKTIPILDAAIHDLRKLEPPADEQDTADQWLEQVDTLREDLVDIRDKARDNDLQGVQAIVPTAQQHNTRSNALATSLGMHVCNKN